MARQQQAHFKNLISNLDIPKGSLPNITGQMLSTLPVHEYAICDAQGTLSANGSDAFHVYDETSDNPMEWGKVFQPVPSQTPSLPPMFVTPSVAPPPLWIEPRIPACPRCRVPVSHDGQLCFMCMKFYK